VAQLDEALTLARSIPDERLELEALLHLTHVGTPDADDLERTISLAEHGIAPVWSTAGASPSRRSRQRS